MLLLAVTPTGAYEAPARSHRLKLWIFTPTLPMRKWRPTASEWQSQDSGLVSVIGDEH